MKASDVLALYRNAPRPARVFLKGRVLLSNLELIESYVPRSGTIVDIGCGHGLFANLMAMSSPGRQVTGIDISPGKIEHARATVGGRANIKFICSDVLDTGLPHCDAVTIVDVMYLLPAAMQLEILKAVRQGLGPGGVLVWKAQERKPRWKYAWTWLQELAATSTGLTQGKRGKLSFLSREEAVSFLKQAGFHPSIVEMPTRLPYTDILYLGRPR